MSENWKNARAEAEMRENDKRIMAEAAQKKRAQELHGKWTVEVTTTGENAKELMSRIVDEFLLLSAEKSPNIKINFEPVIETTKKD